MLLLASSSIEPDAPPRTTSPYPNPVRIEWLSGVILFLAAAIPYLPVLWADFVWDDFAALHENPFLRNSSGLLDIWLTHNRIPNESHYWPAVYTTFWLEYHLWGLRAIGYHAVNVIFHIANSLLLWRLLLRMGIRGAWFAAMLFAAHPVHVESVAWIIERKDVLSGFFYLASAWFFLRSGGGGEIKKLDFAASLLCLVLAMFSKTIAITLPAAMAIWMIWGRKMQRACENQFPAADNSGAKSRAAMSVWVALAIMIFAAAAIGFVDAMLARRAESVHFGFHLHERIALAARALIFYLGKILWPWPLVPIYPKWNVASWSAWGVLWPIVVLFGIFAAAWLGRRRAGSGPWIALLFFAITLSPILGFIDFTYMEHSFAADRFLYLASIGPLALAGAAFDRVIWRKTQDGSERSPAAGLALGLFTFICIGLGATTYYQCGRYRDVETLSRHTLKYNPAAHAAHNNLGAALLRKGDAAEAEREFKKAIEIRPSFQEAWNNLGVLYANQGRFAEAAIAYRKAIHHGSPWTKTRNDLAWILAVSPDAAVRNGREALELARQANQASGGNQPAILDTLAAAFAENGQFDDAIRTAARAVQIAASRGEHSLAAEIQQRLECYKRRAPWRMAPVK